MKIAFVGDVMLGRLVNQALRLEPPEYPWGDTLSVLRPADWRICNLECVISDRGTPWAATRKAFHFRSDAKNVAVLKSAGIDAVSLANNHVLDFGEEAMLDMLRILDLEGIRRAGAGADLAEASRPAVLEARGMRIGLVAFTDNQPEWEATDTRPGVFYVPTDARDARAARLLDVVRRASAATDLLVVSGHWGGNWGYAPPSGHRTFARALIDAGAGVIFGHSCHVSRGIELYRERPVIHSAGDFIDDYAVDAAERNDRSLIFTLDTDAARLRLYPTVIRECHAQLAHGRDSAEIAAKMRELCADLGTVVRWQEHDRCLDLALC